MHNRPPETSGSQHPATAAPRPHSRLWGGVSMMGLLCLLGTFLISGSLFWLAAPETEQQALTAPSTTVPLTHKKIQEIQPGQWVKAENPAEEDDLEFGRHVDPATWKLLTCIAPKLDGTKARVQLLRPELWLSLHQAAVGETIYISVPECGIDGNAQVLEIANCPPIAANPGPGFQIVTGTFQHEAAQTLDISVEEELKPIGTTPNHPIWSVDREAFVRADSLSVGERLQILNGIVRITNSTARGPPEPVYNLEVQVKHTYFVADSGVLVHNGNGTLCPLGNARNSKESAEELINSSQGRSVLTGPRHPRYHFPPPNATDAQVKALTSARGNAKNTMWRHWRHGQQDLRDVMNRKIDNLDALAPGQSLRDIVSLRKTRQGYESIEGGPAILKEYDHVFVYFQKGADSKLHLQTMFLTSVP